MIHNHKSVSVHQTGSTSVADRRPSSSRAIRKGDDCTFNIAAERRYKAEIEALVRAARKRRLLYDLGLWTVAAVRSWLVPEPTNRYDANAVVVATGSDLSEGLVVGYVRRRDAAKLQPRLGEPMPVEGRIIGRGDRWGVKLDQPTMDRLLAGGR